MQTQHDYYSDANQVLMEQIDSSCNPDRPYTWGSRSIDDLVMRNRDSDAHGTFDEMLSALHDANWSITALADTSGTVLKRLRYGACGQPLIPDADFANDTHGAQPAEERCDIDKRCEERMPERRLGAELPAHSAGRIKS